MPSSPFTLRSGRRVEVHRMADGARTVAFCHASPGSGAFDPWPEETAARDVALIAVDRPGYGGSEPMPAGQWSTVGQAADDLAEVLESLETGPVGVAGWSAGGRVALALAARRPELVDRVVVMATPAPDDEVAWVPPPQRAGLEALRGQPAEAVHAALEDQLAAMVPADPHAPEALAMLGASEADARVLALPGAADRLAGMLVHAYAQGAAGTVADIAGFSLRPWGFEPAQVKAKTLLLYGSKDALVGQKHARWWKARLADARIEVAPGLGHLLAIPMWKRALSHLAPGASR